jgi:hypothetical protein
MSEDHTESETELKIEGEAELNAAGRGKKAGKSGRAKEKPKPQPLRVPTDAEVRELAAEFKLETGPAAVLEFVIKNGLADLRSMQRARTRKFREDELLSGLIDELEPSLGELIAFLKAHPDALKKLLPAPAGAKLGELYSFTGIGKALDRDAVPDDGKLLRGYLRKNKLQFDVASAESFYARIREDYGLLQADPLFLYVLTVVHEPLKGWYAAKAATKWGRPANLERRDLIERLAEAAPYILGCDPPLSIGSPFVALCERALPLCGLAEAGIDKAVINVLERLRARRAKRADGPKE